MTKEIKEEFKNPSQNSFEDNQEFLLENSFKDEFDLFKEMNDMETGEFTKKGIVNPDSEEADMNEDLDNADPAYIKAARSTASFAKRMIQQRVNQIVSSLSVVPSYENVDFQNMKQINKFEKKQVEFREKLNLFNMPDILRAGIQYISAEGKTVFLARKRIGGNPNEAQATKIALSVSQNFLYEYDDFDKLTYLMVIYQQKQGRTAKTVTEEYDVKKNTLTVHSTSDNKKATYNLSDIVGTEESVIPAVIMFNPFNEGYNSDLSMIKSELAALKAAYISYHRNIDNSSPFMYDANTGDAQSFADRIQIQRTRSITGQARVAQTYTVGEKVSDKNNIFVSGDLGPSAQAVILIEGIEARINDMMNFKSLDFGKTSAQQNEDAIAYADKLNIEATLNGNDYFTDKFRQLYTLLLSQVDFFDNFVPSINVSFRETHLIKGAQEKQLALQEFQSNLISLETYVMKFGKGTLVEKMREINRLYKKQEEEQAREDKKNEGLVIGQGSDNKTPAQSNSSKVETEGTKARGN